MLNDFNDDDDFNEGYCEGDDGDFIFEKIDIQKIINYWDEKFEEVDHHIGRNASELDKIQARERQLIREQKELEDYLEVIAETIDILKTQIPQKEEKDKKDCGKCANDDELGVVDRDCYMCSRGFENNYEPIEKDVDIIARINDLEEKLYKIEEEI
ncbi:MAG: hypothetical protein WCO84_01105 [bacterium]